MNMEIQQYRTHSDVPAREWNTIASSIPNLQLNHLAAIEQSGINNIDPYYLLLNHKKNPEGIAYFYTLDMDILSINKSISQKIRETMKTWDTGFTNKRIIECGLISGLGETIVSRDGHLSSIINTVFDYIEKVAIETRADFILLRDIPFNKFTSYNTILKNKAYKPVLGFPTAKIEVTWETFDKYYQSLKKKRRLNFKHRMEKMLSNGITYEIINDYGNLAEEMASLWEQVNNRADEYEHEKLTATYFREMNRFLDDRTYIIAIKKQDQLIAFAQCYEYADQLSALHIGLDYHYNQLYDLYFNTTLLCLLEAIKRRKRNLDLGITSYPFKMMLGCELEPMVYFIKHIQKPKLTTALSNLISSSIMQPSNPHRTFKNQDISLRVQLDDIKDQITEPQSAKSNDIFQKAYNYIRPDFVKLANVYCYFPVFESTQKPVIQHFGRTIVMLGSNAYLGLGSHPDVIEAAKTGLDIYGTGCSGSPILNGTLDIHAELSDALARWIGKECVMLFSTGYQTNLGVISAIAGRHDVVISDSLDHASIIDGCQFSRAEAIRYRHDDLRSLEKVLKKYPDKGKLVVVDSVFSMEGTIVDLPSIVSLCKKYNARIMVDEAHGVGVLGPKGKGAVEHFGLIDEVDIIMGTFSKSFAAVGGFIAADHAVIHYLRHVSRPHLFSASLPPSVICTVRKALDIIINEPERREKVLHNAKFMAEQLQGLGYEAVYRGTSIVPVYIRNEVLTFALFKKLFNEGVYVNPVISPAVPVGSELLRTSYMATHDEADLLKALDIFKKLRTPSFP